MLYYIFNSRTYLLQWHLIYLFIIVFESLISTYLCTLSYINIGTMRVIYQKKGKTFILLLLYIKFWVNQICCVLLQCIEKHLKQEYFYFYINKKSMRRARILFIPVLMSEQIKIPISLSRKRCVNHVESSCKNTYNSNNTLKLLTTA